MSSDLQPSLFLFVHNSQVPRHVDLWTRNSRIRKRRRINLYSDNELASHFYLQKARSSHFFPEKGGNIQLLSATRNVHLNDKVGADARTHIKAPGKLPRWRSLPYLEGVPNFDRSLFTVSQGIVKGVTAFFYMSFKAGPRLKYVAFSGSVSYVYRVSCIQSHIQIRVSRFVQISTKILAFRAAVNHLSLAEYGYLQRSNCRFLHSVVSNKGKTDSKMSEGKSFHFLEYGQTLKEELTNMASKSFHSYPNSSHSCIL